MINRTHELQHWFAQHNIPTDGLTLILNFQDRDAAYRFDCALNQELQPLQMATNPVSFDTREFQMNGVKVKIESPLHGIGMPRARRG
jgi:hypothetical protein